MIAQGPLLRADHARRGIALGVEVGVRAGQGLAHGPGSEALRGDEDDLAQLALVLEVDEAFHLGIDPGQGLFEEEILVFGGTATVGWNDHVCISRLRISGEIGVGMTCRIINGPALRTLEGSKGEGRTNRAF